MNKWNRILKTLGPGILFASTAIGVSHLVQSTRAGALYGFGLVWAVVLSNLFKYPFFEYGSRYANATGTSIIDGYKRLGTWVIWMYFLITIGSMFFISSAVAFVTAGFLDNLLGITYLTGNSNFAIYLVYGVCVSILLLGQYKILDFLTKIIGAVLLISTLLAFFLTLKHGPLPKVEGFIQPEMWDTAGIAFIIALMGWMPTAVDLSTWNSLWTLERIKQTGFTPTLKETLAEFNFGYIVSSVLALCFVTLGAYLMHGTGKTFPEQSAGFANTVVQLYTETMGSWSYILIAAAAFSIMFGTSISVFDGYSRALERTTEVMFDVAPKYFYKICLLLLSFVSLALLLYFKQKPSGFKMLVDLATSISFVIAPIIAIINFRLVSKKYLPESAVPPLWLKILSWIGIIFLSGFSILYLLL